MEQICDGKERKDEDRHIILEIIKSHSKMTLFSCRSFCPKV